jgi:oligopeptide transport system permease protein
MAGTRSQNPRQSDLPIEIMQHGGLPGYIAKRLLLAVPTLLILVTISFFVVRFAPGGPFDARGIAAPEVLKNLRAAYNLDAPLYEQYARYMSNILHLDFGTSFRYRDRSVSELIKGSLPASLELTMWTSLLSVTAGLGLGIAAAIRPNGWLDRTTMTTASLGIILPVILVAPLCQLLFGVELEWLPVSGWQEQWQSKLLPVATLSLGTIAGLARLTRASMLESMHMGYVRTARSKGIGRRRTLLRHILPGGLVPILAYLGPTLAGVILGSVVIERVFSIPGLGRLFVEAATSRDYPLVTGTVMFYGAVIILINLLMDVAYTIADPRVRYA